MTKRDCSLATSLTSATAIAEPILRGKLALARETCRIIDGCISGWRDFNDSCELLCDVINHLAVNNYFKSDLMAALTLRSTIQKINHEFQNHGILMFPPALPGGVAPTRYFTLTDAANKLGLSVKPSPEHMGQISGARGLVIAIAQIYPGWWLLGTRWGKEEDSVWFDRLDFDSLIPVQTYLHERSSS